jgi:hypothetical protein
VPIRGPCQYCSSMGLTELLSALVPMWCYSHWRVRVLVNCQSTLDMRACCISWLRCVPKLQVIGQGTGCHIGRLCHALLGLQLLAPLLWFHGFKQAMQLVVGAYFSWLWCSGCQYGGWEILRVTGLSIHLIAAGRWLVIWPRCVLRQWPSGQAGSLCIYWSRRG